MKKLLFIGVFIPFVLLSFFACSHSEPYQKIEGFQMLDFRGNYCYYLSQDYFIFMINGEHSVEHLDDNHDDVVIYSGEFVRFSKINDNFVAVENVYTADGKEYDEYALINLPDEFHQLNDVKIEKVYDYNNFKNVLAQHQLTIKKWEEG